jgi:hypothetical protein
MPGWWFGTMVFYDFPIILGMSSSQLTNSIIFQMGRLTTNQIIYADFMTIASRERECPAKKTVLTEMTGGNRAKKGFP